MSKGKTKKALVLVLTVMLCLAMLVVHLAGLRYRQHSGQRDPGGNMDRQLLNPADENLKARHELRQGGREQPLLWNPAARTVSLPFIEEHGNLALKYSW